MAHRYKTGARPSPRHVLAAATPHRPATAPPPQVAYVPAQLSIWGNDTYGDCVTAEEAFAKACNSPEIFLPDQTVIGWAKQNGFLEGADLSTVLDLMVKAGFVQGNATYDDGGKLAVNWSDEAALQAAIAEGPVKIAIDHTALPANAGPPSGWYAFGSGKTYPNADHCVSICGYGPMAWLCQQLGLSQSPPYAPAAGYLLFTWGSIGIVDHAWIMSTCAEAWVRNPTTVVTGPIPGPDNPPPPPLPPASPTFDQVMARLEGYFYSRPRVQELIRYAQQLGDMYNLGGMSFDAAMAILEHAYPQAAQVLAEIQAIGDQIIPSLMGDDKQGPFGPHPGPHPWGGGGIWPWVRPRVQPPMPYYPPSPYPYYPPGPAPSPVPGGWW